MVRKKSETARKSASFAPPGKVMMIERNRLVHTPLRSPSGGVPKSTPRSACSTPIPRKSTPTKMCVTPKSDTKRKRLKPGVRALREIKRLQASTKLLLPKAPFLRIIREILQDTFCKLEYRFSAMAMTALQEAAEMAIVNLLEVANLCALHAKRVTLQPVDLQLTRRAFGLGHPLNP